MNTELQEQYNNTAPVFRDHMERLAAQCGKTTLAVYALWREYSQECTRRDQSAVMPEFEDWYKVELAPRETDGECEGSTGPIKTEDPQADVKLAAKIAEAEALQEHMKACNAAIRKFTNRAAQMTALAALGVSDHDAYKLLVPDFAGRIGYPNYRLTNNNANIRRMKQRLAQVAISHATPKSAVDGAKARFVDAPGDNRVRLFFPGKPSAEVRYRLKHAGFHWSPSIGAWQAYRNPNSLAIAREEAGIQAVAA